MNNLIGILINDKIQGQVGFIGYAASFNVNDSKNLNVSIDCQLERYGIQRIGNPIFCKSLQDVAHFPYFYETLFYLNENKIPTTPKRYAQWVLKMQNSHELLFLGWPHQYAQALKETWVITRDGSLIKN